MIKGVGIQVTQVALSLVLNGGFHRTASSVLQVGISVLDCGGAHVLEIFHLD